MQTVQLSPWLHPPITIAMVPDPMYIQMAGRQVISWPHPTHSCTTWPQLAHQLSHDRGTMGCLPLIIHVSFEVIVNFTGKSMLIVALISNLVT